MREILFRGFSKNKNKTEKAFYNGKWHKGRWVEGCYFMAKDNKCNILHYISEIKGEQIYKIIPETVGQYVGNGTELWEGDIVKSGAYIGVVRFGEYGYNGSRHLGFFIDWDKKSNPYSILRQDLMFWVNDDLEVIGNIYDNPELLEVE